MKKLSCALQASPSEAVIFAKIFNHIKANKNKNNRLLLNKSFGMNDLDCHIEGKVQILSTMGWVVKLINHQKIQTNCPHLTLLLSSMLKQVESEQDLKNQKSKELIAA